MVPKEVSLNNQACRQENDLLQESLQTPDYLRKPEERHTGQREHYV
jgi:hypothetical protein